MKKYIIFDFDGTILDTNDIILGSWGATCEHYMGRRLPDEDILRTFGETLVYTAGKLFPDKDPAEVVAFYRDWQRAHIEGRVKLFPGVIEMLEELKASGRKLFLVTSRTKEGTDLFVDKFDIRKYFESIVTPADCPEHKPSPAPLIMALMSVFDEQPKQEECIMIGDTKYDIGCANNAGIDGVLVEWSHPINEAQLRESGYVPQYRVKTIDEFMELVR